MTADEAGPQEKVWGNVYNGRYHLPRLDDPSRHQPRGWMRTSNLIGAYSETRALHEWEVEVACRGLIVSPELYEKLCVMPEDATRNDFLAWFEECKTAAKANAAAVRGTARHNMMEGWLLTGREAGTPSMLLQLAELKRALLQHLLTPVRELTERIIVNDELQCAGRFDCALSDLQNGKLLMADLKTKRRQFWTLLEVRAQLAVYARATCMWDPQGQHYTDMPPFDPDEGVIIHMPQDGQLDEQGRPGPPVVHLMNADLRKGWRTALRAREVVDDRAEAKSKATLDGCLRPHPGITFVEAYARRFASVGSLAEGSALVREIQHLTGSLTMPPELNQAAGAAVTRLMDSKAAS